MVHHPSPLPDTGHFNTTQVRSPSKPSPSTSATIYLPHDPKTHEPHYKSPPNLAAGLSALHLSHEHPIRANLLADRIRNDSFRVKLETWGDGVLHEGSATWIEHARGARDCIFGQFDTDDLPPSASATACRTCSHGQPHSPHEHTGAQAKTHSAAAKTRTKHVNGDSRPQSPRQEYSKHIRFPRPFTSQPDVIVWLNRLDIPSSATSDDANFRLRAHASGVSKSGFTAHLDTWADGRLHGAAMCWIAFPRGKRNVEFGTFSTSDVRSWSAPRERTEGRVRFEMGFKGQPTVLAALNMFDAAGNADLRVRCEVRDVSAEGFTWSLDTWEDSTLYAASANWIALGFV